MKEGFNGQQLLRLPEDMYGMLGQEGILTALCIYAIGYFPFASHHLIERPRGMEGAYGQYILHYCVDGEGWCELEGERYTVIANQFFIFPVDKPHSYGSSNGGKWTVYWVRYGGSLAKDFSLGFERPTTIKAGITSRIKFRQDVFEDMYNALARGYTLENLCYASCLLFTYLGSFRYLDAYRNSMAKTLDAVNENVFVREMVHYMQEKIETRITLKDISEFSGYSVTQMSFIFRKHTGYSPLNYFNILKIRYSCWLLDYTPLKIHQVCYKLGYQDICYFSRLFKKITGVSPQTYRKDKRMARTALLPMNYM